MESDINNFSLFFYKCLVTLKQKAILITVISIIGVSLGIFFASKKEIKYESKFSLFLNSSGSGGLNQYLGLAESFGLNLGAGSVSISPENIAELAVSKKIIFETLFSEVNDDGTKKSLINLYLDSIGVPEIKPKSIFSADFRFKAKNVNELSISESKMINWIFNDIKRKRVAVSISNKSSLVKHTVQFKNEEFSFIFSKLLIKSIRNFYDSKTIDKKLSTISILTQKSDSIKSILMVREEQFASLADQKNLVIRKKDRLDELRLAREIEILNAMYSVNIKNLELAKFSVQETSEVFNVLDSPMLPLEKKSPNKIVYGAFGGILCFFFCITFILISLKLKNDLKQLNQINA